MKKYKLKTKKTLSKKVKLTKSGKIVRSHQLRSGHLRRHKSKQALRRHQVPITVSGEAAKKLKRLLGQA
ncbi:50S ribosomal protein L35 [Patescibacteria group bacterium]|nr:50S ribosomal protein L35 [Patescibacteria group bacterium]MCL5409967.1 50S ribosomal protein L35 [Patescibacteria group bacterium]